jgi:hypothetical protein
MLPAHFRRALCSVKASIGDCHHGQSVIGLTFKSTGRGQSLFHLLSDQSRVLPFLTKSHIISNSIHHLLRMLTNFGRTYTS